MFLSSARSMVSTNSFFPPEVTKKLPLLILQYIYELKAIIESAMKTKKPRAMLQSRRGFISWTLGDPRLRPKNFPVILFNSEIFILYQLTLAAVSGELFIFKTLKLKTPFQ